MFCEKCGSPLPPAAQYCTRCGKQLMARMQFASPSRNPVQEHIRLRDIVDGAFRRQCSWRRSSPNSSEYVLRAMEPLSSRDALDLSSAFAKLYWNTDSGEGCRRVSCWLRCAATRSVGANFGSHSWILIPLQCAVWYRVGGLHFLGVVAGNIRRGIPGPL